MNRSMTKKLTLWITGVLAALVLAACGQTPVDVDPGGTSTLSVTVNGNGTVTGDVGGIDCTTAGGDTCTASVDDGTTVTLTATPDVDETFVGWGGACSGSDATCTVTVDADTSVTANFSGATAGDGNTFAIAAGNDDAEEFNNDSNDDAFRWPAGWTYTGSSDLELAFDPDHSAQHVGLRFSGVAIPAGSTIESAYITFTADADDPGNANPVTLTIAGQANAAPESFTSDPESAPSADISSRATTAASADWQVNEAWTAGAQVDSADITAVVQEIVDMEGWTDGNAMAFIITGDGSQNYRRAESFEGGAPPVLHIQFSEPAPEAPIE